MPKEVSRRLPISLARVSVALCRSCCSTTEVGIIARFAGGLASAWAS